MLDTLNFFVLRIFRLHQVIFLAGLSLLLIIDFFFLEKWGTFWLMLVWSIVFGVHYLFFRAQAVDDEWLKEKMAFSVYRLWDYGHIREIRRTRSDVQYTGQRMVGLMKKKKINNLEVANLR